jgi:hypothetical protein
MHPAATATNATSRAPNGHAKKPDMGFEERVDLMMKHTGLTRKQAEAEAAEWN